MKKVIITLMAILGVFAIAFGQEIPSTDKDIKAALIQKWEISKLKVGEQEITAEQLKADGSKFEVEFLADGTCKLDDGKAVENGKYLVDAAKKQVFFWTEKQATRKMVVISLAKESLQCESNDGGKKVSYFFVPAAAVKKP
jgi:hypothetical protein